MQNKLVVQRIKAAQNSYYIQVIISVKMWIRSRAVYATPYYDDVAELASYLGRDSKGSQDRCPRSPEYFHTQLRSGIVT